PTRWESSGGYPLLRLVALMVLRQHLLTGLALGSYHDSELALAEPLWDQLPDASLVIVDRGLATYALWHELADSARQRPRLNAATRGPPPPRGPPRPRRPGSSAAWAAAISSWNSRRATRCSAPTRSGRRRSRSARSATSGAASAPRRGSPPCSTPEPTQRRRAWAAHARRG